MESEAVEEGFDMITRLRTQWESGVNRFAGPGEILLGTFQAERLIAVGGLNRDPYVDDTQVGRLRHLYVMKAYRDRGVGRNLVEHLLNHAMSHFHTVRLWSGLAGGFYDRLGFSRVSGPDVTHAYSITPADGPYRHDLQ